MKCCAWLLVGALLTVASLSRAEIAGKEMLLNSEGIYYMPIAIGDPFQYFYVKIELGSLTLNVPSKACDTCTNKFDATKSSTYVATGITDSGIHGMDEVGLASLLSRNQSFWQVNADIGAAGPYDGVIGFGYVTLDNRIGNGNLPWYLNMGIQNSQVAPIFAFYFDGVNNSTSRSQITIGDVDEGKYLGDLAELPTRTKQGSTYWVVEFTNVRIDANYVQLSCASTSCLALFSTSSPFIQGPSQDITRIVNMLNIHLDCSNYHQLPTVYFYFNSIAFGVPPEAYVQRIDGRCRPYFTASYSYSSVDWVFGTAFMSSVYTVFNGARNTVMLAQSSLYGY